MGKTKSNAKTTPAWAGARNAPRKRAEKQIWGIAETLMRREAGATLSELMAKLGWRAHAVRGFVNVLRSKHGVTIESFKVHGERTYKIPSHNRESVKIIQRRAD